MMDPSGVGGRERETKMTPSVGCKQREAWSWLTETGSLGEGQACRQEVERMLLQALRLRGQLDVREGTRRTDWITPPEFRAEASAGAAYEWGSCPAVCKPRGRVMSPGGCT